MDAANSPVDMERVRLTSDGDKEFECELFNLFLDDCIRRLASLEESVVKRDFETGAREAHTIKGSSANVGAHEVHSASLEIERFMRARELEGVEEAIVRLKAAFSRAEQFMRGYMAG